jgi:HEAT repeat protein
MPLRLAAGLLALWMSGCAASNTKLSQFAFWNSDSEPTVRTRADQLKELRELAKNLPSADSARQEKATLDLAQAIRNERDPILRAQLLRTISACSTRGAEKVMLAGVNDTDANVRAAACEALGRRGGAEAVSALAKVLGSDTDIDVRLAAAKGLGDTRDEATVKHLSLALEDPNPALQLRGVRSLEKVTGKDFGDDVNAWRTFCQGGTPEVRTPSIASRISQLF